MTKNELLEAIKAGTNEAEFETLALTSRSDKSLLQGIFEQINTSKLVKDPDLTEAAASGSTEAEPQPEPEVKTGDDFDELLGKVSGASAGQPKDKGPQPLITKEKRKRKKGESSPDSFRIEGYILLLATDTAFPTILAFINNMVDKKHRKITADELRLAEKDFNKLEPLADQAADYMTVHLNPIAGFFIIATFMYANNIIAVKMEIPQSKPLV
jgi:hypothetical protein